MPSYGLVLIVAAVLLFVVALFGGIIALNRKIARRRVAELEAEGILRRSGSCKIKRTLRDFRSAQQSTSHRMSMTYGELVLTREAVVVVAGIVPVRFAHRDLHAAEVWVEGKYLHFTSSKPEGATGSVEVRVELSDAVAWCELLQAHGARSPPSSA